jgi:hypothetical protein
MIAGIESDDDEDDDGQDDSEYPTERMRSSDYYPYGSKIVKPSIILIALTDALI